MGEGGCRNSTALRLRPQKRQDSPILRAQRPSPPGTQLYSPRPPLLLHPAPAQGWNIAPDRPAPAPPPVTLGHSVTHAHTRRRASGGWMPQARSREGEGAPCAGGKTSPCPTPGRPGCGGGGAELGVLSDKCSVVGLSMLGSTTQYREELQ